MPFMKSSDDSGPFLLRPKRDSFDAMELIHINESAPDPRSFDPADPGILE